MRFDKVNLASQSPRRRELLSKITNNFSILEIKFIEPEEKNFECPETYIKTCVASKVKQAISSFENLKSKELLLVADTTVFLEGKLLGKPQSFQEAVQMLKVLSGKSHKVYTGFWVGPIQLAHFQPEQVQWDISTVKFYKLSSAVIKKYVRSREPMDKAGAYGFQGLGLQLIQKVEGSYTNIMGLPILKIQNELARWMEV